MKNSLPSPAAQEKPPTFSQLVGSLSVGKIWAFVLASATAVAGVGGAGFALGQRVGEVTAQEKLNSASSQLAKAEAQVIVQTERSQQAAEKLKQYGDYATGLKAQITERDKQIAGLSERLGRTNTCMFLQEQIASLQQQIANISSGKRIRSTSIFVFGGDKDEERKREAERKAQDDVEVFRLQQRVLIFTQQLSACAK